MAAVSFARLRVEMEALYKPPHRRISTWKKLRTVMQEFEAIGVKRTSDITPVMIVKWVDSHLDRAPMTNRSYLSSFHQAVKYAKTMGWLRVDPWSVRSNWINEDMALGDEDDDEEISVSDRFHSIEEICALLDLLDAEAIVGGWFEMRLQALGYTYALTGLRKSEALGLKVGDVDLGRKVIKLKTRRRRKLKTKNSSQPLGIAPELHVVLGRWIPQCDSPWLFPARGRKVQRATTVPWLHGPRGEKALDQLKAAGQRAGIGNLTIHSLRRSIATHGKRMGLSLAEMRDQLRHKDVRTTQDWYVEEDLSGVQAIAERISYRRLLIGESLVSSSN